jgi:hypothetical protein
MSYMARVRIVAFAGVLSPACLIVENPAFIDSAEGGESEAEALDASAGTDTGSPGCDPGWLDCDDEPGCESDASDPATCGSCDKACEVEDQMLACVEGVCTGMLTLSIPADTYVDSDQPDQNFGVDASLRLDATRDVYLRLPDLDMIPQGAVFGSITLELDCTQAGGSVFVHQVGSPWDEFSLTQSNAPALDGAPLTGFEPSIGATSVELLDLIGEWQLGSPKRSLGLRANPTNQGGSTIELSSREGPAPPSLVVDFSW